MIPRPPGLKKMRSTSDAGITTRSKAERQDFFQALGRLRNSNKKVRHTRSKSDTPIDKSKIADVANGTNGVHGVLNLSDTDAHPRDLDEINPVQFVHSDTEITNISQDRQPYKKKSMLKNFTLGGDSPNFGHARRHTLFDHSPTIDWKDLRNTLKLNILRKKEKEENPNDTSYLKSAELISELSAGAPAAVIMATMFQRDDRGAQRIPILLEQLKLNLVDISPNLSDKNRLYLVEFEYGSGPARLRWSVRKEFKDFWTFHSKFKVVTFQGNLIGSKLNLPKFPQRHAIFHQAEKNYRRSKKEPSVSNQGGVLSPSHSIHPVTSVVSGHATRSPSILSMSSDSLSEISGHNNYFNKGTKFTRTVGTFWDTSNVNETVEKDYIELLRLALEKYLLELFKTLRFKADANRLFQFLEVSNMTIRLAPESSFHGKEGYLILRSSAAVLGWRVSHWRPNDITQMVVRHTSKWYMVRESYMICVKNISETNILEVFLVDSGFKVTHSDSNDDSPGSSQVHITFQVENLERKMKLVTNSRRQLGQWMDSIKSMKDNTIWSKNHRFNSFAPIRTNVQAQWFVDAVSFIVFLTAVARTNFLFVFFLLQRDYFWAVSAAIDMAKDVIYIHDWWLSPELYLRRPPEGNQKWRIDRLLKRKAEEGVKIFVIVYRNVGNIIPIDSLYTKHSMLDLHPNVYFMRSPNQLIQNTYFWAHHEKLCLIDHTVAFVGGLDLCFGRWDTPDHVLVDDSPVPFHAATANSNSIYDKNQTFQMWPGKDYSNPRQQDFSQLDHPYDDMYDRQEVPRMPWHDVHMMVTGQSARDASRHFVQRWNYMIRQKRPSRLTPMLIPPSDLTDDQLKQANLQGTCEVQFLRSSCSWSLGLTEPELSIQNAYLKAIEKSEHFVYIENQFFITSTTFENTKIENRIGDALVDRIVRAHKSQQKWKAIIVIPLMPGFESEVDEKEGLSVRVIMQCQYLSINHGPNSIFGRLYKQGIAPDDYIQFFSLRQWGKIGPNKKLVTEQLYIHSKAMVVDDRIAIIGSANINERSMRGTRDSEVAAIVRDTVQLESTMAGKPFSVGKFAHTLRLRLMREHLGVDVDHVELVERLVDRELNKRAQASESKASQDFLREMGRIMPENYDPDETPIGEPVELHSFNHFVGEDNMGFREKKPYSTDSRVQDNTKHRDDVEGLGFDGMRNAEAAEQMGYQSSAPIDVAPGVESLAEAYLCELLDMQPISESLKDLVNIKRKLYFMLQAQEHGYDGRNMKFFPAQCTADDKIFEFQASNGSSDIDSFSSGASEGMMGNGNGVNNNGTGNSSAGLASPGGTSTNSETTFFPIDPYSFNDPLSDEFYYNTWERIADQNTLYFREVFHCQPDDEVTTWRHYIEYKALYDKFATIQGLQPRTEGLNVDMPENSGDQEVDDARQELEERASNGDSQVVADAEEEDHDVHSGTGNVEGESVPESPGSVGEEPQPAQQKRHYKAAKRRRVNQRSVRRNNIIRNDNVYDPETAEHVLQGVRGSLVFFPTDWLGHEIETGNWQHSIDHLPPLEIYD